MFPAVFAIFIHFSGDRACIKDYVFIDPPYNTGNEGWVYNDNVNDPKIKKWLGEVVGKEGEDLTRHDKWLCMMYPRLKLLQKLLANDGVIFISIDDTEYANLKLICDEIFGRNCFVSNISWQRTYSTRNDSKGIVNEVEHLVVYSKLPDWNPNKLPRTAEMDAKYKNPDNDRTLWRTDNAFAPGAATHQGMVYTIQHPFTGKMLYPSNGACWRYQQDQMLEIMRGWCGYELRDLNDAHERAVVCGVPESDVRQGVQAIVLSESLEISAQKAQAVYSGVWHRHFPQILCKRSTDTSTTKKCVDQHIELAVNIFKKIWSDDTLDINIRLFIAYIVEERMRAFGDRWMADGEIENIRQWESKNTLDSTLSNNYGSCLEFFVQNELVYASSWTSYGNPREYTLFPSLQELLFNCPHKIMEELQKVKDAYHLDLPF